MCVPPPPRGGHLGGFGAENMFEAQINKLKEKIEHCAYLQGVLLTFCTCFYVGCVTRLKVSDRVSRLRLVQENFVKRG